MHCPFFKNVCSLFLKYFLRMLLPQESETTDKLKGQIVSFAKKHFCSCIFWICIFISCSNFLVWMHLFSIFATLPLVHQFSSFFIIIRTATQTLNTFQKSLNTEWTDNKTLPKIHYYNNMLLQLLVKISHGSILRASSPGEFFHFNCLAFQGYGF